VLGYLLGDESDQFFLNPPFYLRFGDAEPCGLLTEPVLPMRVDYQ
jgi:hypothetical protein